MKISISLTQTEFARIAIYLGYGDTDARKKFNLAYEETCKQFPNYAIIENKKNSIRVRVPGEQLAEMIGKELVTLIEIHEIVN